MASSGAFFYPKTLLYVAPVVSSTCTLLFARDQDFFLSLFTEDNVPSQHRTLVNALLPDHFTRFFYKGIPGVVAFISATAWLSGGSAYSLGRQHGAFGWYVGAATLAAGHLAYVPWIAPRVKKLAEGDDGSISSSSSSDDKAQDKNAEVLREWLGLNKLRMWTTDLGAWMCCLVAVAKTLVPGE